MNFVLWNVIEYTTKKTPMKKKRNTKIKIRWVHGENNKNKTYEDSDW